MHLITLTDAAARLGVSRQQVGKYIDSGRIRAVEVAGRRLVVADKLTKPPARKPGPKSR